MSCPELDRLSDPAALDAHLAFCPECRRLLEVLAADTVPPNPARRARLATALAAPRSSAWMPLAAAAALLLAAGIGLLSRNRPLPKPSLQGSPVAPAPAADWRMAWLEERPIPPLAREGGGADTGGAPETDGGFGKPGAPGGVGGPHGSPSPLRGKGGGSGGLDPGAPDWTVPEFPQVMEIVARQLPFRLWLPKALPRGLNLSEARVARPTPDRKAAGLVFSGAGRRLVILEEAQTGATALPTREGLRALEMDRDGLHLTLAGQGWNDADWERLSKDPARK